LKKYFPIFGFCALFTGFLLMQMIFDVSSSRARLSDHSKKVRAHYKSLYKQQELISQKKEKIKLKDVKSSIVILNFWASWCTPCLEEFPSLVSLRKKFDRKDISIFAISSDTSEQRKDMLKVIKSQSLNFPVIEDPKGDIFEKFMVTEIPMTIVYKNGELLEVFKGGKDFSSVETINYFTEKLKSK